MGIFNKKSRTSEQKNIKQPHVWADTVKHRSNEFVVYSSISFDTTFNDGNIQNLAADMTHIFASDYMLRYSGFPVHCTILPANLITGSLPADTVRILNIMKLTQRDEKICIIHRKGSAMDSLFNYILKNPKMPVANIYLSGEKGQWNTAKVMGIPFDSRRDYWIAIGESMLQNAQLFSSLSFSSASIITIGNFEDAMIYGLRQEYQELRQLKPRSVSRIKIE